MTEEEVARMGAAVAILAPWMADNGHTLPSDVTTAIAEIVMYVVNGAADEMTRLVAEMNAVGRS